MTTVDKNKLPESIGTWKEFEVYARNALDSLSDVLQFSGSKKLLVAAALFTLFHTDLFAQRAVSDKDLEKQYSAVMKDLRKDPKVDVISQLYGKELSKKDVIDLIQPEIEYVVKTLIKQVYVDHLTINKDLNMGFNKQNLLERIYLSKKGIIQGFADELGTRMWNFKTDNKASYQFPYPVWAIDDNISHYATDKVFAKQLTMIDNIFTSALRNLDHQFVDGVITLHYPLQQIYDHHKIAMSKIKDSQGRAMTDYIKGTPERNAQSGSVPVTFDFNQFKKEDLILGEEIDQSPLLEEIFQEAMFLAGLDAYLKQYNAFIDKGRKDLGTDQ